MTRMSLVALNLVFILALVSCKTEPKEKDNTAAISIDSLLQLRYQKLLEYPLDSVGFPRSYTPETNKINKVPSKDWTSGFFPGNLWHLYQLTGMDAYKERAAEWTPFLEKEKFNDRTHDMGFKVFCSFGEGLKVQENEAYKKVIVESAQTLATRFNENVGSLRSWDFNRDIWEFPVIIDNMMNLELLFEATRISGDSTYHNMAVVHANTTLANHYREDGSTYHVVVYDTITGAVKDKVTHQGINDDSSWARGQAWGIYGYTMTYRYTRDPAYLERAKASAAFFLEHPNLREDGIPYWDFDDPKIPDAVRDVSAATIVASAFFELSTYDDDPKYLAYANKVLDNLMTPEYVLEAHVDAPFILDHSTGNWPKNDEMDEPIVYADYYFLEALLRQRQ
ncbi:glycoside hydrolase family 88 protein [Maribacter sp. 2307ULW6-5]|uniref:glycoside hydrolase family 88 protein n=1 Tax=Maribacter sp. 2307ULW6-5 TaxID=3386275 RepID=UPI0039BD79CC